MSSEEINYLLEQYEISLEDVRRRFPGREVTPELVREYILQEFFPKIREKKKLMGIRKTIASRLSTSYRNAVHVTIHTEACADALVSLRTRIKEEAKKDVSYTLLAAKLTAKALTEHREFNATFEQDEITIYDDVNIAIAVDTPFGLLTPVLRRVDKRDLFELQNEYATLVERARAGKLKEKDIVGGTFTMTNLGMFDTLLFDPIINPPQVAILGLNKIYEKIYYDEETQTVQRGRYTILSLTFDHRVVDGAPAARFLQRVRYYFENPQEVVTL